MLNPKARKPKKHDLETMFILQRFGLVWKNIVCWCSAFRIEHSFQMIVLLLFGFEHSFQMIVFVFFGVSAFGIVGHTNITV